jgi:hypothetical protein
MERLRTRTAHADLAPVAEGARFSVIVSSTDSISSARIEFNDPDGMPATRTVSGRTCDEVVSAAALITALTIEASSGAPSPADPKEPTTANPLSRDTPLPLAPREPPPRWLRSWGFGATGGIDSWTPGAGFSWGGFGELAASAPLALVRLTALGATSSTSVDTRSASFTSLMARITVCPLSLRIAEPLFLIPCSAVDMGRVTGQGEASADLPTPHSTSIFWSSIEAMLLVRWHLGAVVALEAGAELGFPLVRHTFVFEGPTQVVYDVPSVGVGAHAAFAVRFH